jgi:uncharacterized protein YggE
LFLAPFQLLAKEIPKTPKEAGARTITVTSEAKAGARPDLAVVSMHFTAYGWTVNKASSKVEPLIKKFLDKLAEANVSASRVQIGEIKLKPSFQFNRDLRTHIPSDFLVSRQVDIQFENTDDIGRLMDASLSVGSFLLESARLTLKDKSKLEKKAFDQALEAARRKAQAIAENLEGKIGGVLRVEEIESEIQEVNLIQETDFAMLAASQLKADSGDATEKEPDQAKEPQEGKGFLSAPDGEKTDGPSKPVPSGLVKARSRLQVTFLFE